MYSTYNKVNSIIIMLQFLKSSLIPIFSQTSHIQMIGNVIVSTFLIHTQKWRRIDKLRRLPMYNESKKWLSTAANNPKRNHQNYMPPKCDVSTQYHLWSFLARKPTLNWIKSLDITTNFKEFIRDRRTYYQ